MRWLVLTTDLAIASSSNGRIVRRLIISAFIPILSNSCVLGRVTEAVVGGAKNGEMMVSQGFGYNNFNEADEAFSQSSGLARFLNHEISYGTVYHHGRD